MILEPLDPGPDHSLPGEVLTEVTQLYAANREFFALSGDFPDPDAITTEQVAAALADELARPGAEVLLARAGGRLAGIAVTLEQHPDAADPDPWIGLLMIEADRQRRGLGGELALKLEDRFRAAGRAGVRLAVLDADPGALAFWTALGYEEIDRRPDAAAGRPCRVLRKPLAL